MIDSIYAADENHKGPPFLKLFGIRLLTIYPEIKRAVASCNFSWSIWYSSSYRWTWIIRIELILFRKSATMSPCAYNMMIGSELNPSGPK